MDELVGRLA